VKSALEELRDIDNVSVTMTTSGATRTYTVTFGGVLAGKNVPLIQAAAMPAVNGAQQGAIDYKYNSAGLLSEGGDSSARYTWAYDQLNRQTSETADLDPANPLNSIISLTQAFNVAGKRVQFSARFTDFAAGGTVTTRPDFRNVFEYDNLDRLKSIQQTALGGANSNAVAPKFVNFGYNLLGQLTALNRFENTTATGPALRTTWSYDGANRLSTLRHENASGTTPTLLNQYSYTYDLMNRITGITSTLDGPSTFTYDRNSQLKTASHPTPRAAELYDYDANGNRTGGAQQVGVNNQTLADDKYTYQYDAEGNRTRRTNKSPNAVDPIEDYAWDHRNRLTKITFRSAAGVETRSIEYRYDLLNRLVLRRLDSNGAATAGGVSDLWLAGYDGINPMLALSSLNSTAITNRYLWGPGVDFLLADEQLTTASAPGQPLAAGNTLWPLGDHLGTLRDLADFTGGSFTITNHRVFDTFGRLLSETNSSVDSHFAFTGKFFEDLGDTDPTTSLSHHWNRWYDPQLGKWVSEDPIGFAGGDANLGRYVGNYVLRYRDSNGLDLLDTMANLSAGLGDGMSFGIGWVIRDKLVGIETVDYDSGGYYWGGWTGVVADFLTGGGTAALKSLGKGVAKSTGKKFVKEAVEEGAEFIGREVLEQTARRADDLVRAADDLIKGTDEVIQTAKEATKAADEAIRQADELLKVVDSGGDSTKLLDDLLGSVKPVHKNSLEYVGDTHVYRVRGPEGTFKIGESAQGVRVRDGASIRGEQQARRLTRETGDFYESEIRRTFPDKQSARDYETRVIERFRKIFGEDSLPGNKTNR
jgi:RHS repeat-associated protein